jgi:hypothetical protein
MASHGVEVKSSEAPTVTRSMRSALEDLRLDLWIVWPCAAAYEIDERISVRPIHDLVELCAEMAS